MVSRAGFSADLSGPVMTRAICHFDNAYWLPDVAIHGYSGKTNTQSNTAFRGFGGPQGAIAIENIVDSIARKLGKDPLDVRRVNFYGASARPGAPGERNVTPYGQTLDDNIVVELVAELEATSRYRARRTEIAAYNATQRGAEARPRADAGQVRHLVQPGPSQPGRRAGPRLRRRLGAGQPWRHRDGPGAQHQGRPGRRPRARHRLRRGARHRDRHAEDRQHLGDGGIDRQRPERQGRRGRGATDQGAADRLRRRAPRRRCERDRASPTARSRSARRRR